MRLKLCLVLQLFVLCFTHARPALAATPSQIGWFNTFVPGGGKFLEGEDLLGAEQALLEVSTFGLGYGLSAKSPMTLDGVPENIPAPHRGLIRLKDRNCQIINRRRICHVVSRLGGDNFGAVEDIQKALVADILQEIGIKAHMVNVYDAYRLAMQKGTTYGFVDQTSTPQLFSAPFQKENLFSAWVAYPLLISLAYHAYEYSSEKTLVTSPLTSRSKSEYALVYGAVYPFGSAAPEEMFFRGFLQNEAYAATESKWLAVFLSSAAYTLSHSPDSYVSAAVSGVYLGTLTYHDNGALSHGITFHFWSDVIGGIHSILSLYRNQAHSAAPVKLSLSLEF
jgi:hypothetical protein